MSQTTLSIDLGLNDKKEVTYENLPDVDRVLFPNLTDQLPYDEMKEIIEDWLEAHPEATTSVEDGSLLPDKLDSANDAVGGYTLLFNGTKFEWIDLSANFAGEFDASHLGGYSAGEYVMHEGQMYIFTADHAGNWSALDVQAVTVSSIATGLKKEIGDLKQDYNKLENYVPINLFDVNAITTGKYKKAADGTIGTAATWFYSDLIPVEVGKTYFISGFNSSQIAFYAGEDVSTFVSGYTAAITGTVSVNAPNGAKYMTISQATDDAPNIIITESEYIPNCKPNLYGYFEDLYSYLPLNLFDANKITSGKYKKAADGTIGNLATWFYSDIIPVIAGENLTLNWSNNFQLAFYTDANISTFVSGLTPAITQNYTIAVPETAKYMTISGATADANSIWITRGFATSVKPDNKSLVSFLDKRYIQSGAIIEVGASGYDYTSVLEAVEYVRNNGITNASVLVHAGTYNLINEIVALKGQSFIDNYSASEYASPTGLKGLFLGNGIKVIGDNPNDTIITCEYTGDNNSFKNDWSVFHVYNNEFTISGLTIIADNVRYCLHDDGRVVFGNDTGIIENCKFVNESINYGSLIGAGLWGNAIRYIRDCQFINNQTGVVRDAISYHPNDGSYNCEVHISNIYCNACGVDVITDGTNTYLATVYVSNSKMPTLPSIIGSGSSTDDVSLIYWNIETD